MLYNCTMSHVAKIKCVRFIAAAPVSSCFPSEIKKQQQKKTKYICVRRWSWTAAASNPSFPLSAAGWCLLTESRKPHFFWSCRMFSHDTHQGKSRISSRNAEKVWAVFFFSLSVSRFCFDLLSIRLHPLFGPFVVARPARGQPGSCK